MKTILYLFFFLACAPVVGQYYFTPDQSIPVSKDGALLKMPWLGGFNNPQFSQMDLNGDGVASDLFIHDKADNQTFILLNETGQSDDYTYWREGTEAFPDIIFWALMRDYNCDEIPDLFFGVSSGLSVYTGVLDDDGRLSFDLYVDEMLDVGGNLITVAGSDLPAIVDVDDDGLIDLLTFNPDGGYVWFYKNQASECGELQWEIADSCWGDFYESGITDSSAVDLMADCNIGGKASPFENEEKSIHPGSTILAVNMGGNSAKELVLGDVSFDNLVQLTNGGSLDDALMVSQDVSFPNYNVPAVLMSFPAAFSIDADNDGLQDILVSANNSARYDPYFGVYYYRNIGSESEAVYSLQQKDYLIDQMIEVGEYAHPTFFDYNSDGLLDLLIGNQTSSRFGDLNISSLFLYENVGTATDPAFSFVTDDFGGLSAYQFENLTPTTGDVNGDGAIDIICGMGNPAVPMGNFNGTLIYMENKSNAGETAVFSIPVFLYQDIDVKQKSAPQLVDVDEDGLLDLLIGNHNGQVWYYHNNGTVTDPVFTKITETFGNIDVRSDLFSGSGNAVPFLTELDNTGARQIIIGTETNNVFLFEVDNDSLNEGSFIKISDQFSAINEGEYGSPTFVDIDNDGKLELFLGLKRGGVVFFENTLEATAIETPIVNTTDVKVFPNPSSGIVNIQSQSEMLEVVVYNSIGQVYSRLSVQAKQYTILPDNLPEGLCFLKIIDNHNNFTIKKVTVLK